MSDDPNRLAKTAYLKRSTGHSLTDKESRAVEVFLTKPEGCAYAEGTEAIGGEETVGDDGFRGY